MYKGDHKKGEIEITSENIVFSNEYATLYNDDVIFPSGKNGKYLRFEWNSPYGVMIFPKNSLNEILLIKNFRHESRSWSWEVPKGFGELNLSPQDCAKKELLEETGYSSSNWELVKKIPNGQTYTYIYSAVLDRKQNALSTEVGEAISESRLFSKDEMLELLESDMVSDPMTLYFISQTLRTNK